MNKRRRPHGRTIRHIGRLRNQAAVRADQKSDPDYPIRKTSPLNWILREGNLNEVEPATFKNHWARVRAIRIHTTQKIGRLRLRRLARKRRNWQKCH